MVPNSIIAALLALAADLGDVGGSLDDQLANLNYLGIYDQPVQLADGRYEGMPYVEGGASRPVVRLADLRAEGSLSGDAIDEIAVLLSESSGGSGTHIYLGIVENRQGQPRNVATIGLGDRIQVRSLSIENGYIQLELITTGPGEPACCPTLAVRKSFGLENDRLVEVFSEELGAISIADLEGVAWRLVEFGREDPVDASVHVTARLSGQNLSGSGGCNRYFAAASSGGGRQLSIGPPGSTRRACPEPQMQAERRYFGALETVRQFGFVMGRLALTYGDADRPRTLLFAPDPTP